MTGRANHFDRGLSSEFLAELIGGRFQSLALLAASGQLDLQIRNDYINLYHDGASVLNLTERKRPRGYRAVIHEKFLQGVKLPHGLKKGESYWEYEASDGFVAMYLTQLPRIRANADRHAGPEAIAEQRIVAANGEDISKVVLIDRQIQVPGIRRKADLVGLSNSPAGQMSFVLVELKQGLDSSIQELADQMGRYHEILAGDNGVLRRDLQNSYRKVVTQKQALELLPEGIHIPDEPIPVTCLLVLYDYNPKSELLNLLRPKAAEAVIDLQLVLLPKGQFCLPSQDAWELL
jgi:hypothetical protein